VQGEIERRTGILDTVAVDFDTVRDRVRARAKLAHDRPIDGHAPIQDPLLSLSARRQAGMGKDFLQSFHTTTIEFAQFANCRDNMSHHEENSNFEIFFVILVPFCVNSLVATGLCG
jgi:hypothetical protein